MCAPSLGDQPGCASTAYVIDMTAMASVQLAKAGNSFMPQRGNHGVGAPHTFDTSPKQFAFK